MTPTPEQLPGLVERALAIVEIRLSGSGGTGLYDSVRNQLVWIRNALAASRPADPERVDKLLLGVYAAREFEQTDPELANLLFDIEYLAKRRWPADQQDAAPRRDLTPLLIERMKRASGGLVIVAAIMLLGSLVMAFLSFALHPNIVGRTVLLLLTVVGLGATAWLITLLVTGAKRAARLLEVVEHNPERIERIYAGKVRNVGFHAARMDPLPPPESEKLSEWGGGGWYVILTRSGSTRLQRFFGLNFDSIKVPRDEVLPLLDWLRTKAPSAAGPPDPAL